MNDAITVLIAHIANEYVNWSTRAAFTDSVQTRADEVCDKISVNEGKKYIKIIKDGSVWGFIVNVDNDKQFAYGDILKAASWKAPARNHARGNVFENYAIDWTGPLYMSALK